jgi:hypothetical protein
MPEGVAMLREVCFDECRRPESRQKSRPKGEPMTEELVDIEAYRRQLVERLESMREFRSTEAEDGAGDERMARAAEALRTSVHEIDELPVDDARLHALALAAESGDDHSRSRCVELQDHVIGRHGLDDGGTQTTDELLAALMKAIPGGD